MSQYLSQSLVHAHLPCPPSIPDAIPELRVDPNSDTLSMERSTLPHAIRHAISFSYEPEVNVLARLIHNGYVLELRALDTVRREGSFNDTQQIHTLRIIFPSRLVSLAEDSIVLSLAEQMIYVFAYSQANVLYRMKFPLIRSTGPGTRMSFSINGGSHWVENFHVPEELIAAAGGVSAWSAMDEDTAILGGQDGGIIRVARTEEDGYRKSPK